MTALAKPDGVRGIVSGDVLRRLVARTMAQQLGPVSRQPLHLINTLWPPGHDVNASPMFSKVCDLNLETTVTSIDGVSTRMTLWRAMLTG